MDDTRAGAVYRGEAAHPLPSSTDEARDAVERTRGRISETLDEIEGRLVSKKEQLKARADIARPVRDRVNERPFQAVGIALGAGLLLGLLTGARD